MHGVPLATHSHPRAFEPDCDVIFAPTTSNIPALSAGRGRPADPDRWRNAALHRTGRHHQVLPRRRQRPLRNQPRRPPQRARLRISSRLLQLARRSPSRAGRTMTAVSRPAHPAKTAAADAGANGGGAAAGQHRLSDLGHRRVRRRRSKTSGHEAQVLPENMAAAITFNRPDDVDETLAVLKIRPHVRFAASTRSKGELVSAAYRARAANRAARTAPPARTLVRLEHL